ncbi:FadR/GntR family transcriptional regulator [Agrococcus beijingensis]|uniref:FadR/GntR family transcriptional regulator n=1 Tax=Agrococcus beijingensis TaxID=3068634 RepID=UPI0027410618|nr:FCD domain-containing protein [Agrococcus sp. REN33]
MPSSPIASTTLTAQVQRAILELIDAEGLAPGQSLPSTAALSERFDVSRPVVREALSALHAIGAVELTNGRNAVVRRLDDHLISLFLTRALQATDEPLVALMEVRAPLEIQAARLAAERADPASAQALVDEVRRMATIASDGDAYAQADLDLHRRIAELTGNPALVWFTGAVRDRVFHAMVQIRAHRERHGMVGFEQAEHMAIAGAIASGNAMAAEIAMREHMGAVIDITDAIEQRAPHTAP